MISPGEVIRDRCHVIRLCHARDFSEEIVLVMVGKPVSVDQNAVVLQPRSGDIILEVDGKRGDPQDGR